MITYSSYNSIETMPVLLSAFPFAKAKGLIVIS